MIQKQILDQLEKNQHLIQHLYDLHILYKFYLIFLNQMRINLNLH